MARGPKVSEYTKTIIAEIYYEHPKRPAKDIQKEANKRLNGKGPGKSCVQKFLAEIRKRDEEIDPRPDLPWSLGSSAKYNIPPEANQDLMKIWKWCTVVGMTLTIREAQWVTRLKGIAADDLLFLWAIRYARREQVCRLLGQEKVSTTDLDMRIIFPIIGISQSDLEDNWMSSITRRLLTEMYDRETDWTSLIKHEYEAGYWEKEIFAHFMDTPPSWVVQLYLALLPQHNQTLSESGDIVYAIWLRLFANGMKWKRIAKETKNKIAEQLYEEVRLANKEINELTGADGGRKTADEVFNIQMKCLKQSMAWKPSEKLLQEVGISEKETEWKLVTYESERPGKLPLLEREQNITRLQTLVGSKWPALIELVFPESKED